MRPEAVTHKLSSGNSGGPPHESRADSARTDAELLAGFRQGNEKCWDILVQRYQSLIFTAARQAGLPDADAADVVQATFLSLLEAIRTIRDDERLGAWLMTVAHRQVWRARRRLERDASAEPLPPATATIEEWERVIVLHDALVRLGSPCRELLFALYLDPSQPTYTVIAARLGLAMGTIGPMRGRCVAKLRALAEDD